MKKITELPRTIYSYKIPMDSSGDNEYLVAFESLENCAEVGEIRLVGVYELKETKRISLKVTEEVVDES